VDGFAHGIFPLTSRSFNHSCSPNAIAVYSVDATGVRQDVIALKEIPPGEEVSEPSQNHSVQKLFA
jgi:SET and MYND domain-containing protein